MFSIKSTSSSRTLIFSHRNGEYFRVALDGEIAAATEVWVYTDALGLAKLFEQLGGFNRPWRGEKGWQSIEGEFSIQISCSPLCEVLMRVQLVGLEGAPEEWRVTAGLATEFGQLERIANGRRRSSHEGNT